MNVSESRFPFTRHSAVLALASGVQEERSRAYESIVTSYWKPVYKYIRLKWNKSREDAQDLTQGFFVRVLEKGFFDSYDPGKSRFRTFLRVCLHGFVANEERAASRLKRGGHLQILPLDFAAAEGELGRMGVPLPDAVDDFFDQEWVRHLFSLSLESFRKQCENEGKEQYYELFRRYHLDDEGDDRKTYESVAKEFGVTVTTVTNYLAFGRRAMRRIVLEKLREITASEEEFRREARTVLGIEP